MKSDSNRLELHIPFVTFLKIGAAIILGYCFYMLWSFLLVIFLSLLVAVTLLPAVRFLVQHRFPKWAAILLVSFLMVGGVIGTFALIVPSLTAQIADVAKRLPEFQEKALSQFPEGSGLRGVAERAATSVSKGGKGIEHLASASLTAFGGLAGFIVLLVTTIYLLIDGPRAYEWCLAFFSEENRKKLIQTKSEVSKVIFAYIAGQFITSLLASIFVFIILTIFKVPAAVVIAVLAGIFDILPVIGFFISFIPAVMMALTVSTQAALAVGGLYIFYHGLESYLIIPKVYGNRMEVSGLVVLLTLIIASTVGGILGAIAILPVVASYPIIERIWLEKYVGRTAVVKHKKESTR